MREIRALIEDYGLSFELGSSNVQGANNQNTSQTHSKVQAVEVVINTAK